jgi:hypothetical protein
VKPVAIDGLDASVRPHDHPAVLAKLRRYVEVIELGRDGVFVLQQKRCAMVSVTVSSASPTSKT